MSAEGQSLIDQYRAVTSKGSLVRITIALLLIAVVVVQVVVLLVVYVRAKIR